MPPDQAASTPASGAAPAGAPAAAPGESGAAAALAAPATPQGTDDAIAAARARVAGGGSVVEQAAAGGDAADAGGAQTPPATGADAAPGKKPAEEKPEGDGAGAEGAGEEPTWEVTLPGLKERSEQDIVLTAPDQETFDRVNRMSNEAEIGREVKTHQANIERAQEELAEFEDMISMDPVGFVTQHMPAQHRPLVALQLLLDPQNLGAVQAYLADRATQLAATMGEDGVPGSLAEILEDPRALRLLQSDMRAERGELEKQLRLQGEERKTLKVNAAKVREQIESLLPTEITGEQRTTLYRDVVRDVKETAARLKLKALKPEEVELLVVRRFAAYGLKPKAAAAGGPAPRNGAAPPSGAPDRTQGRSAAELQAASATRRAAAAAAPAGVGAPASPPREPLAPDATTSGVIEKLKAEGQGALRKMLGRRAS
jgi:hypothetical protein